MILLSKKDLHPYLDLHEDKLIAIAHKIWGNPEVGFGEHFAAKLQMDVLKDAGFRIKMIWLICRQLLLRNTA